MWIKLTASGSVARQVFSLSNTGATDHYLVVRMNTSEILQHIAIAGASNAQVSSTAVITGLWAYFVARFVSATQRRMHVYVPGHSTFAVDTATNTTSRTPTGLNAITLGAMNLSSGLADFWDGILAEWWMCRGDITSDSLDMTQGELHALAYGGPFNHPRVAGALVDYKSMRQGWQSEIPTPHVWTAVGPPGVAAHPPLPYWYARPDQVQTELVI
jgi:hypothetical protein